MRSQCQIKDPVYSQVLLSFHIGMSWVVLQLSFAVNNQLKTHVLLPDDSMVNCLPSLFPLIPDYPQVFAVNTPGVPEPQRIFYLHLLHWFHLTALEFAVNSVTHVLLWFVPGGFVLGFGSPILE